MCWETLEKRDGRASSAKLAIAFSRVFPSMFVYQSLIMVHLRCSIVETTADEVEDRDERK